MIGVIAALAVNLLGAAPSFTGRAFTDTFSPRDKFALTLNTVAVAREATQECVWYEGAQKVRVSFKGIGGVQGLESLMWAEDSRMCIAVIQQVSANDTRMIYALVPRKGEIQISPSPSSFLPSKATLYAPPIPDQTKTDPNHVQTWDGAQWLSMKYPTGFVPLNGVWDPITIIGRRNSKGETVGSISHERSLGDGQVSLTTSAIFWNAKGEAKFLPYPKGYISGEAEWIDEGGRIAGAVSKEHMYLFRAMSESYYRVAEPAEPTVWTAGKPQIFPFARTSGNGKVDSRGAYAMTFGPKDWVLGRQQEFRTFNGHDKLQDYALLWTDGRAYDLNTLWPGTRTYILSHIIGVNEKGQILCATDDKQKYKPGPLVLLTPKL
ncbi:MAG: hypothetical protein KF784_04355 [Fimbriimonadaceae bacterium]|nr:hypothetical protein [Fimbriimonadaceae bacterium]